MASADWTEVTGSLSSGSIVRGVTAGLTPPNGGGSFVYGGASLDPTVGGVALYANASGFAPVITFGGSVRGAVQRKGGGGNQGFSPFLYLCLQSLSFTAQCYMLGLSDADPHRIVLVKAPASVGMGGGIPAAAVASPPVQGVLAASTRTFSIGTWLHLRLDAVVNADGDTVLNCYQNDLLANTVGSPVWAAIPGIPQFIDDVLQVNTGSAPLAGGYMGFGMVKSLGSRVALFDELEIIRQTS
jgi:hypothetical protein